MPESVGRVGARKYSNAKQYYYLSEEELAVLRPALIEHFSNRPNVDDPVMKTDLVLRSVQEAKNLNGTSWKNAPFEFDARLKKYGFDYQTMSSIPGFFDQKEKKKDPTNRIPRELKTNKNGNPITTSSLLTHDEEKTSKQVYKQLLKDFPEIEIESDKELLRMLAKQMVIYERITNHALANGQLPKNFNLDGNVIQNIERLEKMLGIDRPSREKVKSQTEEGSVADLVVEFEEYVNSGQFAEREKLFMLEEWALLLRKLEREDVDKGTEIDELVFQRLAGVPSYVARQFIKNPYYKDTEELKAAAQEKAKEMRLQRDEENAKAAKKAKRLDRKGRRLLAKKLKAAGRTRGEIRKIVEVREIRRKDGSQRPTQF